jgi:hypothetical protein
MSYCVRSRVEGAQGDGMIEMRRAQLGFGDGLIAEEVSDLRKDWMRHTDQVLADEQIVAAVYDALAKRHPKNRSRGRLGNTGRSGAAAVDPQAHPQLELCRARARSAR